MNAPPDAGFILVDKPAGWTSHDVVAKIRGAIGIKKVGHSGTLDPMATGLLVVGIGRATRLLRFVQAAPKRYVATVQFGVATDSLDAAGAIVSRDPMPVSPERVEEVLTRFTGSIMQIPPMVSARKVEGRRLYELAREGVEVEREARPVAIHDLRLVEFAPSDYPVAVLDVTCSTGTYIRTLADDVARALGGRAHLTALRRIANGRLSVEEAHTVEAIAAAAVARRWVDLVLSPAEGLADIPAVTVDAATAVGVGNGVPVARNALGAGLDDGPIRLMDVDGTLLAVYTLSGARAAAEVVLS